MKISKEKKKEGKVYLVGSGPGDPRLITIRGKELIEQADVLVYDHLSPRELLSFAPRVEKIYVGKQSGVPSKEQGEINQLLVRLARQGKRVVRLKGGDPLIFGRGSEEAGYLASHRVPFEFVPGVTAALGAASYAGIPLTDRGFASQVTFITAKEDPRKKSSAIAWPLLAKQKGTLVFYMATKNLRELVRQLVHYGMSRQTPVAVIQWATRSSQRVVTGSLVDIVSRVEAAQIGPPTVILIGEVVKRRPKLDWFSKKPLLGKKILVTRSRNQASELSKRLSDLGGEVVEFPTIRILPPSDWARVDQKIKHLSGFDWIVFTSANGVSAFFERLSVLEKDARSFNGVRICAIGPATAMKLRAFGLEADLVPERFSTEGLTEALKRKVNLRGKRFLLARADGANPEVAREIRERGGHVEEIELYRTRPASRDGRVLLNLLKEGGLDFVTFTSSSTVKNFVELLGQKNLIRLRALPRMISIGPVTSGTMKSLGLQVTREAKEFTISGLVNALLESLR